MLKFRPHVVDLSFIVIFYAKTSVRYALIIWLFFCYFFQRQPSKDHLTQGNLLKTTLNEKQSNFEKKMYGNISLYSQYFSAGTGSNVHTTYLYFLKLTKKYFILSSYIKKAQYKIKNRYM